MSKATRRRMKLGPWNGGVNLRDHPQAIADDELAAALNIDINRDGSLRPRPTYWYNDIDRGLSVGAATVSPTAGFSDAGSFYLVTNAANKNYVHTMSNKAVDNFDPDLGVPAGWVTATTPVAFDTLTTYTDVFTYKDNVYLMRLNLLYWATIVSVKAGSTPTWTSITAPSASATGVQSTVVIKDRLFVAQKFAISGSFVLNQRVYWSKATDFSNWVAPDGGFVDVGAQNSKTIRLIEHIDSLIILKEDGLWRLTWDSDPATGNLQKLLSFTSGIDVLSYRGRLFVLLITGLHEFVNGYLLNLSEKVINNKGNDGNTIAINEPGNPTTIGPGGLPTIVSFAEGVNTNIGPIMTATKDRILISGIKYGPFINLTGGNIWLRAELVYDLNTFSWVIWKAERLATVGGGYGRPVLSNSADGVVMLNAAPTVNGAWVINIQNSTMGVKVDWPSNKVEGGPYSFFVTKHYIFGDMFKWKKFSKFLGNVRNFWTGNSGTQIRTIFKMRTFDPENSVNNTTESYDSLPLENNFPNISANEQFRLSGFWPFTQKFFKSMEITVEILSSGGNSGTLLYFEVPYFEVDVDVRSDTDSKSA